MDYQIINEHDGAYVKVPVEDWEDIILGAEASKVIQALQNGEDELIPGVFADRLLDGENPVRVYRELRSLNQTQLAKMANITQAMVSEIERGVRDGSFTTMARLASALSVDLDDLV